MKMERILRELFSSRIIEQISIRGGILIKFTCYPFSDGMIVRLSFHDAHTIDILHDPIVRFKIGLHQQTASGVVHRCGEVESQLLLAKLVSHTTYLYLVLIEDANHVSKLGRSVVVIDQKTVARRICGGGRKVIHRAIWVDEYLSPRSRMVIQKRDRRIRLEHRYRSHACGHGMSAEDHEQVDGSQCNRTDRKKLRAKSAIFPRYSPKK